MNGLAILGAINCYVFQSFFNFYAFTQLPSYRDQNDFPVKPVNMTVSCRHKYPRHAATNKPVLMYQQRLLADRPGIARPNNG